MAKEQSAFTSDGREAFPPIYEDNKDVRNFSDEKKWPVEKLLGRYAMYARFLERDDIMPNARQGVNRIMTHMEREFPWRAIYLFGPDGDCPTVPIDTAALKDILDEQ